VFGLLELAASFFVRPVLFVFVCFGYCRRRALLLECLVASSVRVNGRLSCFSSILGYLLFRTIDIGFPIIESSSAFACFIC